MCIRDRYCGSTRALAELARIKHRRGDGPEVAEEWYKEAMEKECETAIYYKGFDLYMESDAEADRARGLELLKRAAAAGSSEALFWLAHYYEEDKARPAQMCIRDRIITVKIFCVIYTRKAFLKHIHGRKGLRQVFLLFR